MRPCIKHSSWNEEMDSHKRRLPNMQWRNLNQSRTFFMCSSVQAVVKDYKKNSRHGTIQSYIKNYDVQNSSVLLLLFVMLKNIALVRHYVIVGGCDFAII